jgi:hypothetical protein
MHDLGRSDPRMHAALYAFAMNSRRSSPLLFALLVAPAAFAQEESIVIFQSAAIEYDSAAPESVSRDGYDALDHGRAIEALVKLPDRPHNLRDQRQIVLHLEVTPAIIEESDGARIADPWTRIGSVMLIIPEAAAREGDPAEAELMRFVTGFGGQTTFEEDITAFAPLLGGDTRLRAQISTFVKPGWRVSMRIEYRPGRAGYRRPMLAAPAFTAVSLTATQSQVSRHVTVPAGLSLPRIRILSSGHGARQEFLTATHILRIDGAEVARWRPWREDAGTLHDVNPTSYREDIDGRVLWSSDIDRAGWIPGAPVEPFILPLPELTPGDHMIEIAIEGIQPPPSPDESGGYWIISAVIVADEPWPRKQ